VGARDDRVGVDIVGVRQNRLGRVTLSELGHRLDAVCRRHRLDPFDRPLALLSQPIATGDPLDERADVVVDHVQRVDRSAVPPGGIDRLERDVCTALATVRRNQDAFVHGNLRPSR